MAEAAGTEVQTKNIADSENHEVAELPSQPSAQQVNSGGSYCAHHPKELIKMYCYDDNITICLICFAESHQSHKCADVEKAAGEFVELLKEDRKTVTSRLTEYEEVEQKLQIYEKEFTEQISETEETIRETGTKLKKLIDDHTELLIQNLKSVTEKNVKVFENTKQDISRFKVEIDSYSKTAEELLSQTSSIGVCKATNQMHVRACELKKLPANFSGDSFRCDTVTFHPSCLESLLEQRNSINTVGELTVAESPDRIIQFEIKTSGNQLPPWQKNFCTVKVSGIPPDVTKDMISLYFENKKLSGGGKHEVLEHNEEEGKVVIKFNNHEGLQLMPTIYLDF